MTEPTPDATALRARLLGLRDDLHLRLLAILADVETVLAAMLPA